MTSGTLIETHGYWILAVGCLLEGETILVLAGFAAHRGYLNLPAVLAIAWFAGFLGDQFFFWYGRWHGAHLLARWPSVARKVDRVNRLTARYHEAVVIGVRFAYGLRVAGPVLIGMSEISGRRFVVLNAAGALLWACIFSGIGWAFGQAAEALLGNIRHVEEWLLLALAAAGAIFWWIRRNRAR